LAKAAELAKCDKLTGARLSIASITGLRLELPPGIVKAMSNPATSAPVGTKRPPLDRRSRVLIGLALVIGVFVTTLGILRGVGLIRPFSVPTGAMAPAIVRGDHMVMERITFLTRKPRRGDIAVFKTDNIEQLPPATIYLKRIAGEPGEHLRISEGKLYINDKHVPLRNALGEIAYDLPLRAARMASNLDVTVPLGQYYVLGDNSSNSSDSRFWGCVPAENIIGRIGFRYWPPQRVGRVK